MSDAISSNAVTVDRALFEEAISFVDRHSESWYRSGQDLLARLRAAQQVETTARRSEFHTALLAEIKDQKALIERMDNPPNHEMRDNGIMTVIRAERLDLLEKLLDYEPAFSEKSNCVESAPAVSSGAKEPSTPCGSTAGVVYSGKINRSPQ